MAIRFGISGGGCCGICGFQSAARTAHEPRRARHYCGVAAFVGCPARQSRDTAACMLILSAFAVWGAWPGGGPFGSSPDDSFLISTIFLISASVLGLMLSADITQRQRVKAKLRLQEQNLRTLLSHADVGLAQIDTTARSPHCRMRAMLCIRAKIWRPMSQLVKTRMLPLPYVSSRQLRTCRHIRFGP